MTLTERDRRALLLLALAVAGMLLFLYFTREETPAVVGADDSVELMEKRLAKLREQVATGPSREEALKQVSAELALREKGLIAADTAAQAQAQLLQILRRVGRSEAPPVDLGATEVGQVRALGDAYGEVNVAANFQCRIEQLVNLLASLTAQPEIIGVSELRVVSASQRDKTLNVRLGIQGVVAKKLVPDKKRGGDL
mgnify:CR=1 FL=1|jgi:hypothetical protein